MSMNLLKCNTWAGHNTQSTINTKAERITTFHDLDLLLLMQPKIAFQQLSNSLPINCFKYLVKYHCYFQSTFLAYLYYF